MIYQGMRRLFRGRALSLRIDSSWLLGEEESLQWYGGVGKGPELPEAILMNAFAYRKGSGK